MSFNLISKHNPLSIEEISAKSPAIFAMQKHFSRSEKYNFISTETMLRSMMKEKFYPFSISQASSRSLEKQSSAKHIICFRHESSFGNVDEEIVPQVVIVNAHDGTSCYRIYCGFFRFVCSNGLVVGNTLSALKVFHKGVTNTLDNVIDASFKVLEKSKSMLEVIDAWKGVTLSKEQRLGLSQQVYNLKFSGKNTPIRPEQFLTVHNNVDYDNENNLWNTYNILQENLIKGGLEGYKINNKTHSTRKIVTREITNISQNIKYNTELWNMSEKMYDMAA